MTQHWYDTFFRGIAVDFWRSAIPPEMTAQEVEFLRKVLSAGPGRHLLDVPCGAGRHLIPLALRGCRMTGVDISEECLAAAREDAALAGDDVLIELHHADMRDLPWESEFDGACCCGNSFGYMDAVGADQFIRAVHRTLKPGSAFVLETGMAAESILPALRPGIEMEAGEITVRSETHYHAAESRLDIDYTFERDGVSETRASSHYVLTAAEIRRLLERAGFSIESIHGDMAEPAPYQLGSPRLVIVSRS